MMPDSPTVLSRERSLGERYQVDVYVTADSSSEMAQEEMLRGLTGSPKSLPPKYFYDSTGSELFERITELPEYYPTRVEQRLLASWATELMAQVRPEELIELGTGSTAKVRSLLDAPSTAGHLHRYVALDVSEHVVETAVKGLTRSYPFLYAYGMVGDFQRHMEHLPASKGRRLVVFFGSTIGNLDREARHDFLVQLQRQLTSDDRLLLGIDLVKDRAILEAAYNDAGGVTAQFNRNILRVVNRTVGADFQPEAYQHRAFFNRQASRIEMHLVSTSHQTIVLRSMGVSVRLCPGETIWTESSYKFTRDSAEAMLEEAGMRLERWYTDSQRMFALVLASRR